MKNINRLVLIATLAVTAALASANDGDGWRSQYYSPPRVQRHDTIKLGPLHFDVNRRSVPARGYGYGYGYNRYDNRYDRNGYGYGDGRDYDRWNDRGSRRGGHGGRW